MKFRFVKYLNEIYLVVGIGYDSTQTCPEFFVVTPIEKGVTLGQSLIYHDTRQIPFSQAIEITNKNTLLNLMVLYAS